MSDGLFSSYYSSKWLGAFFFWTVKGFRGGCKDYNIEKYALRNAWTGYVLMLIVAVLLYVVF
ncbi:hypothetical protein MUY27_09270 [Mucilaginibacter sp. RS28]|uniref:Uncharacterized protein n=1 Tax=Mucilaginibacter straminoryzae TaxID=2932774 RepID=A0A9X2BD44_9SPHI|nr:hypothetical protein [Mucilaginibacter straminoryzae]MCJ8209898.1 hypothetical protein [Mucilaginibacter straminoryzae]